MGSSGADGDGELTNVLFLKSTRKPWTLILSDDLVAKWVELGYIKAWDEGTTANRMAFRQAEPNRKGVTV